MPTDPSSNTSPLRVDSKSGYETEGPLSRVPLGGFRAESARRRAHRDRIKSLLLAARTRLQTA